MATSLSANPKKWSDTLKIFVGKLPTNCLSVFDHYVSLALKGLIAHWSINMFFCTKIIHLVPTSKRRIENSVEHLI